MGSTTELLSEMIQRQMDLSFAQLMISPVLYKFQASPLLKCLVVTSNVFFVPFLGVTFQP